MKKQQTDLIFENDRLTKIYRYIDLHASFITMQISHYIYVSSSQRKWGGTSRLYNIYEWGHCAGFFHFNEEMTTTTTMRIAKTKTTITHDDKR